MPDAAASAFFFWKKMTLSDKVMGTFSGDKLSYIIERDEY